MQTSLRHPANNRCLKTQIQNNGQRNNKIQHRRINLSHIPTLRTKGDNTTMKTKKIMPMQYQEEQKSSQGTRILQYFEQQNPEYFHDERHENYVKVPSTYTPKETTIAEPCQLIIEVDTKDFREYLHKLYYNIEGKSITTTNISSAIATISGECTTSKEITLYNRVAPLPDGILLDCCHPSGKAIKILNDGTGYKLLPNPPIAFRRFREHQKALAEPIKPENLEEAKTNLELFLKYINIKTIEDQHLILAILVTSLIPGIEHPITNIYGSQDTGKTMIHQFMRKLIDPSLTPTMRLPNEKEIEQTLEHNYLCYFDNAEYLPKSIAAILCQAVTGEGISKRKLFCNNTSMVYSFMRNIGINGITDVIKTSDLQSRTFNFELTPIETTNRQNPTTLRNEFDNDSPKILGALLTILSKTLELYPTIHPTTQPRFGDFNQYGMACYTALGYSPKEMENTYAEKETVQKIEAINADEFTTTLMEFLNSEEVQSAFKTNGYYRNSPREVYQNITKFAENIGVHITDRYLWPQDPTRFSVKLKLLKASLTDFTITEKRTNKGMEIDITPKQSILQTPFTPTIETKPTPKRTCHNECLNFDKSTCTAHNWKTLNQESILPPNCKGYNYKGTPQ